MIRALHLSSLDDVAVLIDAAEPGDVVLGVVARDPIAVGHKMAVRAIPQGATVRKYGQAIGTATRDIDAGEHVHSDNLVVGGERSTAKPEQACNRFLRRVA